MSRMTRAAALVATALASFPAAAHAADLKVATTDARDIAATTVTLNADVEHAVDGGQVAWQYGLTPTYGSTTLPVSLAPQDAKQSPTLPLSCLSPNTIYHLRAVVTSGLTVLYGNDKKLQTAKATPGSAPATCGTDGAGTGTGTDDSSGSSSGSDDGASGSGAGGSGTSGSGSGSSGSGSSSSGSGSSTPEDAS